jgi:hypothetical protein
MKPPSKSQPGEKKNAPWAMPFSWRRKNLAFFEKRPPSTQQSHHQQQMMLKLWLNSKYKKNNMFIKDLLPDQT